MAKNRSQFLNKVDFGSGGRPIKAGERMFEELISYVKEVGHARVPRKFPPKCITWFLGEYSTVSDNEEEEEEESSSLSSSSTLSLSSSIRSNNHGRLLSMEEVRKHCTSDDCWIVVEGNVYDVTKFVYGTSNSKLVSPHPGGPNVLLAVAGYDTTEAFHAMHGTGRSFRRARAMMQQYKIGQLVKSNASTFPYFYTVGTSNDVPVPAAPPPSITVTDFDSDDTESNDNSNIRDDLGTVANSTASSNAEYSSSCTDDAAAAKDGYNIVADFRFDDNSNNSTKKQQHQRQQQQQQLQHDVAHGNRLFEQLRQDITNDKTLWEPKWIDTVKHTIRAVSFYVVMIACLLNLNDNMNINNNSNNENYSDDTNNDFVWTVSNYKSVVGGAVCLGMFWHQCAFVAHDACHRGTPEDHGTWHWLGWIYGSIIFGISTSMWGDEHYVHHVATRRPHYDPQFRYYPIALLSLKELDDKRLYPLWIMKYTGLLVLQKMCGFLLIAAVLIGRINLHIISIVYCVKHCALYYIVPKTIASSWGLRNTQRPQIFHPELDLIGMILYWIHQVYIISWIPLAGVRSSSSEVVGSITHTGSTSVFFEVLTIYGPRIVFFCLANWTTGILHIQLLVSHIGVESFTQQEQQEQSWLSHQTLSSRNVTTTSWDTWYWGGLEYQIEHHLFPRLPRESLAKIAPRVEKLCNDCQLPYRTHTSWEVVSDVVHDLQAVAQIAFEIPA